MRAIEPSIEFLLTQNSLTTLRGARNRSLSSHQPSKNVISPQIGARLAKGFFAEILTLFFQSEIAGQSGTSLGKQIIGAPDPQITAEH